MSTPADNPATPLPEARGYRVLGELGHGGMSTVYLAEQLALGRQVALKVMSPQALGDETSRRRFENEVRTIARLEHPNIVRIHELGRTADGLPFYSMPHLPRGHLGSRDYTRDSATVVKLAGSLLAALEYAHSRNVVHRDVKPENILFDEAGRPLLADFGIALQRGFGPRVTAAGMAVGSTAYMAPEQARGEDVDGRADLYAMGVVIWEMLAGRLPYEAQDALSMAIMHAQSPIPKLPRHLAHWQKFMQRALAKDPAQRFQTATEMREALRAVRIPQGTPLGERARAAWASRRFRLGTAVALGLVAVAAAAALLPGRMSDGFFRPEPTVAPVRVTPPKPAPVDSALPAPPDNRAALEAALTQATTHLQRGELVEPASGNAVSALLTAWHADPADPRVAQGLDALLRAMGERTGAHVRARRDDDARALYARAQEVAKATGQTASPAHATLGEAAKAAAVARMEQAARQGEREPSEKALALAREFGLTRREATRLQAKLAATVRKGGGEAQESGVRVPLRPVSRSEYERFAQTTGRPASICRERASVLRVFKPRDWRNPGFAQGPSDAVVCVSLRDAEAYAQWLSAREGARYRLPSGDESNTVAPAFTGRTVGLWLRDCGGSCRERRVTTGSWRGRGGAQALAGDRGYDDVGFRLIREK